jgi:hypothetical protein
MRKIQTIALAATLVFSLTAAPSVQAKAKPKAFNGKICTIVGTSKGDKLTGTTKADVICGLGGNDTIDGLGGNDTIDGGAGNDKLSGGDGIDAIDGGAGNDVASGQNGNDVLTGDAGNDSLNGGIGNDTLQGETGADLFIGGAGADTAVYSEKTKNLTLDIDNKADDGTPNEKDDIKSDVENITGGKGNDTITGSSGVNIISGGAGNDTLKGGAGNDTIDGGNGNDTASGGNGNDTLFGANGDDSLNGQAGKDTYDGGGGLNSCYVEENEQRDFTCSLLPNLTYLLKRVSGEVKSPGYNLEGCDISLYRKDRPGGPVVQALIHGKNKFTFDAPAGNYDWLISGYSNGRGAGGSSTCNVSPSGITIWGSSQVVDDNTPFITFEVPRLVKTRVYVRNSLGTPLRGALIELRTGPSTPDPLWCPIAVTNMCGTFGYGVGSASDPQPRTNSSGYFEVNLPEGVKVSANAEAIFAGITMETNTVEDAILSYPSTNIDLVIQ